MYLFPPLQLRSLYEKRSKKQQAIACIDIIAFSYIKGLDQTHCLCWKSQQWVDCFDGSRSEWKTGWRDVSWGLFTHQHSVDEGQTQLVKVKVFTVVESLR